MDSEIETQISLSPWTISVSLSLRAVGVKIPGAILAVRTKL
jgi:hypothetical protein